MNSHQAHESRQSELINTLTIENKRMAKAEAMVRANFIIQWGCCDEARTRRVGAGIALRCPVHGKTVVVEGKA